MIAVDSIDAPDVSLRRNKTSPADAALLSSVRALGILQPVLLRPEGNRFTLVAGARRVWAAREIGLETVPAVIRTDELNNTAAAVAENLVRLPLSMVEEWRALTRLIDEGYTPQTAAGALGIDERRARQLDKLGRLHPGVLDAVEADLAEDEYLDERSLSVIASAPLEAQEAALDVCLERGICDWNKMERLCRSTRISRDVALFDVAESGIVFEEDLFAEPGSPRQFTTGDVVGFMKAQWSEIETKIARRKHGTWQMAECTDGLPRVPSALKMIGNSYEPPTLTRKERDFTVLCTVVDDGWRLGEPSYGLCVAKSAAKTAERNGAGEDQGDGDSGDDEAAEREEAEQATPAAKEMVTKKGRELIAAIKTQALHARLRKSAPGSEGADLCALLVLALHARNVGIKGYKGGRVNGNEYHGLDLQAQLVRPDGHLTDDWEIINDAAREALARTLHVDGPDAAVMIYNSGSGSVAEWIGFAIGADHDLPRFDTAEILATVDTETLRAAAEGAGIKPPRSAGELRKRLTGQLPDWRPPGAEFGAPGPVLRDLSDEIDDDLNALGELAARKEDAD